MTQSKHKTSVELSKEQIKEIARNIHNYNQDSNRAGLYAAISLSGLFGITAGIMNFLFLFYIYRTFD